jgi:hypothetical protein
MRVYVAPFHSSANVAAAACRALRSGLTLLAALSLRDCLIDESWTFGQTLIVGETPDKNIVVVRIVGVAVTLRLNGFNRLSEDNPFGELHRQRWICMRRLKQRDLDVAELRDEAPS